MKLPVQQLLLASFLGLLVGCSSNPSSTANKPNLPITSKPTTAARTAERSTTVGLVVGITDGDTITVLDDTDVSHKIRLQGIDAPEKQQAFSEASRRNLANAVAGKRVTVESRKIDRNERIIGKVILDGRDICIEQIRAGLAWHFKKYEDEQDDEDRSLYDEAERQARSARRGLWKDSSPTPPWNFRHPDSRPESLASQQISGTSQAPQSETSELIRGNKRSMIYQWPGCPHYDQISPKNRITFNSREDAQRAGYRPAKNCS